MYTRDRSLARRVLSGDERAFDEFFEAYFPGLYRFALSRVDRDHDEAEEIAQATLCKAISKLATYRGEASLFTWLCTFCRHEISAHYRRRDRSPRLAEIIDETPELRAALESAGASERDDNPAAAVHRGELARLVQIVLDGLPPHYGSALEWKYLEEVPVIEIADRLGMSAKAAESLLTRARAAFRDAFASVLEPRERGTLPRREAVRS
ncbi:MAG TPA: RNA polymerase sigma factor [Candidatus Saccharimonadales bacterium]|nr:RNA polymerase sigma factor [Candidatus Saccharimonadales bacterium]